MGFKKVNNIAGWIMFGIAMMVYALSAEPAGSLWDCGEFVSSAYKLQVCHPPGAPFFLMVGRLFAWVAGGFSKNPSNIAYAVNLSSGLCTALAAMFCFWITSMFSKILLVGKNGEVTSKADTIVVLASGFVAGLCATFATSIWFSAVEGEVYAMSLFFTALNIWLMMRWYTAPETPGVDRWLIAVAYMLGLSSTVHLLSILTIPAFAILYYLKRWEKPTARGYITTLVIGLVLLCVFNFFIIPVLPSWGAGLDKTFVNSFGLPFGSGLMFFILFFGALMGGGIWYARKRQWGGLERAILMLGFILIGFSTYAMIYVRANANPPINMNDPKDPYTFVSYLKREQYGERPLFKGPHFAAEYPDDGSPRVEETGEIWRPVNGKYEVVGKKLEPRYKDEDYMLFPRLGHADPNQVQGYRQWLGLGEKEKPTQADNMSFMVRYQYGWMFWRYMMWNFCGRQNGEQGYYKGDPSSGHSITGINAVDSWTLGFNQSQITQRMKEDPARNRYYLIPFLLGLLGMVFQFRKRGFEASAVLFLFLLTGPAIVFYMNEPPIEPRERDYGHNGAMFSFAIWIGIGVTALYYIIKNRIKLSAVPAAVLATVLGLSAPLLMGTQNWDDHSRAHHYAARDYASNFLNSVAPNAIIFTYGDNDTYPLWYCQEVEGIRRDVRVVNFSLLAVDWYIDQLRRSVNESPGIKMTIPSDKYLGEKRNYIYNMDKAKTGVMSLAKAIEFIGKDQPNSQTDDSYLPASNLFIPIDKGRAKACGAIIDSTASAAVDTIRFQLNNSYLQKDEIALLDIINSNINDRPIYYAVTCRPDKVMGLKQFLRLEGLGLRIVPYASPEDRSIGGGQILSYGSVDIEKTYDIIMHKWKFGQFDTRKTYIDRSYLPSVQSMHVVFMRLANALINKGDKARAKEVLLKYFHSFPDYNFPLDRNNGVSMLQMMYEADGQAEAQPYMMQIAESLTDNLRFLSTVDGAADAGKWNEATSDFNNKRSVYQMMTQANAPKEQVEAAKKELTQAYGNVQGLEDKITATAFNWFKDDYQRYMSAAKGLIRLNDKTTDTATKDKINAMLTPYTGK